MTTVRLWGEAVGRSLAAVIAAYVFSRLGWAGILYLTACEIPGLLVILTIRAYRAE